MYVTYNTRHIEFMTPWCTSHWMHVTFKARVHKVWVHRVWHTNSSTRSLSTQSWVHKLNKQSWHTKFINEFSVNEFMNNIHVNVYRHVEIHKRIHDVGWVVEKQTRRVCGAVSPDLSLQVHSRVFDLAVRTCMRSFRPKGRESVLSTRPTSEVKQFVDSWTSSSDRPSLFQST